MLMKEENCLALALVMNEWATADDLKGLLKPDLRALLSLELSKKLEHSLPDLAVRNSSAPRGGLCGIAFLYKALHNTVLTESQLLNHSYSSMKNAIVREMNMSEITAQSEDDFYILGLYHDYVCSGFGSEKFVNYQNYSTTINTTIANNNSDNMALNNQNYSKTINTTMANNNSVRMKRAVLSNDNIAFYGNTLIYECGLGRRFYNPDLNIKYTQSNLTCNWNKTWTPSNELDNCVWVACINPPKPPWANHLKLNWDGVPVNFSSSVAYTCDSDDRPRYFEHDRDALKYNVTCLNTGGWAVPATWPRCVDIITCSDPPQRPSSGTWDQTGKLTYLAKVTYSCGPFGRFQLKNGSSVEEVVSTCMWNKSFVPDTLPDCRATSCPLIPTPAEFTGLVFKPDPKNNFSLTSENAFYSPKLPFSMKFNAALCSLEEYSLTIIGRLTSDKPGTSGDIVFATDSGDEALHVQISLHEQVIYRYAFFDREIKNKFGAPGDRTTIDLNETFSLKITCDADGWIVKEGPKVPNYPHFMHQIPVENITAVELTGSMDISFVGFGNKSLKLAPELGFNLTFACPLGKKIRKNNK